MTEQGLDSSDGSTRRPELVIAVSAALGTDLDRFCDELAAQLLGYNYAVRPVRLSELIKLHPTGRTIPRLDSPYARMNSLMDAGTTIRVQLGDDGVALLGIAAIEQSRKQRGQPEEGVAYLIRSLKHPREVHRLREVYGSGVIVIGVHANREQRLHYLEGKQSLGRDEAERLMAKDEAESDPSGQRTRDVFELADAFITVDGTILEAQIGRIVSLLFGNPFVTPTKDEHAMFLAFATGMRSADLSRQVGAVILNEHGEVIGCGTNEVPKAGGGQYSCEDHPDRRDFRFGYESNHSHKERLAKSIVEALGGSYDEVARRKLKATGLFDLTEYGRAVHAEMEAIMSCARSGVPCRGGDLYSTTYPCHNCAKHIISAGIKRVVYVEPYPKSRAAALHGAEIQGNAVVFEPFEGVGPRRYVAFFSLRLGGVRELQRKGNDGLPATFRKHSAELRFPLDPASYLDKEAVACRDLEAKTSGATRGDDHAERPDA